MNNTPPIRYRFNSTSSFDSLDIQIKKQIPNQNSKLSDEIDKIREDTMLKNKAVSISLFAISILFGIGVGLIANYFGNSSIDIKSLGAGSSEGLIAGLALGIGMLILAKKALKNQQVDKTKQISEKLNKDPIYLGL